MSLVSCNPQNGKWEKRITRCLRRMFCCCCNVKFSFLSASFCGMERGKNVSQDVRLVHSAQPLHIHQVSYNLFTYNAMMELVPCLY